MKILVNWARAVQNYLSKWTNPAIDELVSSLIRNTASLELAREEFLELAPIRGCCGPFRLSGNSLPVFEYIVFEKKIMEFVKIRVEVSKPDRMEFQATIESAKTSDPKRHGEVIEVKAKYREPFGKLSWHLFNYFPYYRCKDNGIKKEVIA